MQNRFLRWAALCCLSLALTAGFAAIGLPGAILVGPMLGAIVIALSGPPMTFPRPIFTGAQGIIGCLVASTIQPSLFQDFAEQGFIMILAVAMTIVAGGAVGYLLVRFGRLPGSTAAWGSSPGAASVMILMSAEFGADMRIVAFMQYLRVFIVVISASIVSRWLGGAHEAAPNLPAAGALGEFGLRWTLFATLAIACCGAWAGFRLRLPAGGLLVPMAIAAALNLTGMLAIDLPRWLLDLTYFAAGTYIGLAFDRQSLVHAFRALPQLLAGTGILIALCGGSAWALMRFAHADALTAYLATTPGGLDSVAVIAASSHADVAFVLGIQTLRLFIVILTGPPIAKILSRMS